MPSFTDSINLKFLRFKFGIALLSFEKLESASDSEIISNEVILYLLDKKMNK